MKDKVRMQKANAMGSKPKMGSGGGNTFNFGNSGKGSLPSKNTQIPSKLATKQPKG